MEAIENLLNTQITILVLLLVGFVLSKRRMLTKEFRKNLSELVLNFILPCSIIKSFMMEFNGDIMRSCLAVFLVSCGTQALCLLMLAI